MKDNLFYFVFVLIVLITARLLPHPPNFSPIIATAIMSPLIFKDRFLGMLVPVLSLFISDLVLGFHVYQLVVYSSIIFFTALGSSIWFFITTNFAVWLVWDYYPKSFDGLLTCYTLALPFFTNTLISTFLFTGIILFFLKYLRYLNTRTAFLLNTFLQKI